MGALARQPRSLEGQRDVPQAASRFRSTSVRPRLFPPLRSQTTVNRVVRADA